MRKLDWRLIFLFAACFWIGNIFGWFQGKRAADRWWQKEQKTVVQQMFENGWRASAAHRNEWVDEPLLKGQRFCNPEKSNYPCMLKLGRSHYDEDGFFDESESGLEYDGPRKDEVGAVLVHRNNKP